jgi:hypothetical protein
LLVREQPAGAAQRARATLLAERAVQTLDAAAPALAPASASSKMA